MSIQLDFYAYEKADQSGRSDGGRKDDRRIEALLEKEPVLSATDSHSFQLLHCLADLEAQAARRPAVPAGEYPVEVSWTKDDVTPLVWPTLAVELPGAEEPLVVTYPHSALRGEDVLRRECEARPELADMARNLVYVARPGTAPPPRRASCVRRTNGSASNGLAIRVPRYGDFVDELDPAKLPRLSTSRTRPGDVPILVPVELLERLGQAEASRTAGVFVERAYYLLGRIGRSRGDLQVRIEDAVLAETPSASASHVELTPASRRAARAEADRRNAEHPPGDGPALSVVGWLHLHDVNAIARQAAKEPKPEDAPPAADGDGEVGWVDNRFFSELDVALHRRDFSALSVALVLDAEAARFAPLNLERNWAAYGTDRGVVVRRGLFLHGAGRGSAWREEDDHEQQLP